MVSKQAIFKYKTIKGHLHKWPPMLKLFLLLPLSIFCLALPSFWLFVGIITSVIAAFLCRFTLREQLTDLKPAAIYASLMYALSIFSNLFNHLNAAQLTAPYSHLTSNFSLLIANCSLQSVLLPHPDFLRVALRLTLIIQLSALLFRTTSSIEIRECLNNIELFIRRAFSALPFLRKHIALKPRFAEYISAFLMFIPEIFSIWTNIDMAWKARGGKNGLKKINMLVFVLISLSFEKAAIKAKAMDARSLK